MPNITINSPDGDFSAYLAVPNSQTGPGILAIQEIFGVNQDMRDHCDAWADRGYFALCPDLYWRQEPGIELTDQTDEEWQKAASLYYAVDVDKAVEDLQTSLMTLRAMEGCTGKVGTMGFCLGGLLTYLMATRSTSDCNVGYYGVGIDEKLDEASNISKPTLLHIAEEDRFVNKEAQAKIKAGLNEISLVTVHSYAGQEHAFARHMGTHYDAEAAKLANDRTVEMFEQHLR
ncbi:MAG: dienelactone hydrolase family protein [Rhodobiaceae bacterium]|nr:dienelactone hydrolase family protein [Rhodobiaceae bacterium]